MRNIVIVAALLFSTGAHAQNITVITTRPRVPVELEHEKQKRLEREREKAEVRNREHKVQTYDVREMPMRLTISPQGGAPSKNPPPQVGFR